MVKSRGQNVNLSSLSFDFDRMATVSAALKSRVRRPQLLKKVMTAEETLPFFKNGQ